MRIAVIGTGYVGLVTGVCLADAGNHVVCVDIDAKRVEELKAGRVPFYEPGLQELANFNMEAKRLTYTTEVNSAVKDARVVFLAVGTPTGDGGRADLSQLEAAAAAIAPHLVRGTIVVNKSTVPVGSSVEVERILEIARRKAELPCVATPGTVDPWAPVISNPEFLAEGRAVEDFAKPDRIVVGVREGDCWHDSVVATMRELYQPFLRSGAPLLFMSPESAELSKYASNGMLATRISYINEIATLCESMNADVEDVRRAMGLDRRIGQHFLYPGIGFGGSCFGKDVRALVAQGIDRKHTSVLLSEVLEVNRRMKHRLPSALRDDGGLAGQNVAIWGLAFKPNTDDVRDAPALTVISDLVTYGADRITCFDPIATESAVKALDRATQDHLNDVSPNLLKAEHEGNRVIRFCSDMYEACMHADALIICTEWSAFRSPDWARLREAMRTQRIYDGRNVLDPAQARAEGFFWTGIGRP
jgi:UDPglucose 6-dehydrogenase